MILRREEKRDLFWAGFVTGAVVGGALGVMLASEIGRNAYRQVEVALQDARNRLNGKPEPKEQAAEQPEPEKQENPAL